MSATDAPTFAELGRWLDAAPRRQAEAERQRARDEQTAHVAHQKRKRLAVVKRNRTKLARRFKTLPAVEPAWRLLMAMEPVCQYGRADFEIIVPDSSAAYSERQAIELRRMGMVDSARPEASLHSTSWSLTPAGVTLRGEFIRRRMAGEFIPSRHHASRAAASGGLLAVLGLVEADCPPGVGRSSDGKFLAGAPRPESARFASRRARDDCGRFLPVSTADGP